MHTALHAWFRRNARDLPWRHTRNPYHILVSEMMLQQTQVERVLPHYAAFLAAFPTLEALATAPTADVIRQWAGLGYNRRAVNLQRIARIIHTDYDGVFPQTVQELQPLPGIGPYTAGAVACFAFEQDVAFLDTNMRRVLHRCLVGPDTSVPLRERDLLRLAHELVPPGDGWLWNQALMELGAVVCMAATPTCEQCPLCDHCATGRENRGQQRAYQKQDSRGKRRIAERPEPFVGSNRYYRGRVVAVLRNVPAGASLSLAQLGIQVKEGYCHADEAPWLRGLLNALAHDGLIEWADDEVRLPGTA